MNWLKELYIETVLFKKYLRLLYMVPSITTQPVCFFFNPEEEISNMRSELEKYGIQMPAFSKIGGILANELSVDEAARESSDIQLLLVSD